MNPLVSVVTPSFNMAPFLRQTIESVLGQDYPHIQYVVMDGGSTDGSMEILRQYEGRLCYVSRPDRGQSDAVNAGFALSSGAIFAFLNADDTYLPGAVAAAVRAFEQHPEAAAVYGQAHYVDEQGAVIDDYPTRPFNPAAFLEQCYICQPASFLRRDAFSEVGLLDPSLHFALDYDLWIRIAQRHPMLMIDEFLACSRLHAGAKTVGQTRQAFEERLRVLERHYGYVPFRSIYGYAALLLDGRQHIRNVAPPNAANVALSMLLGTARNLRRPLRFWRDAWNVISREGLTWRIRP